MGILRLKNDQKTTNPPHASQLVVGEIAINAVTGKLYTKLVNGSIVEFVGRQVCFSKMPAITFDNTSNFCCHGDILNVKVLDLMADNEYAFEIEDLSGNNIEYAINNPTYTNYTYTHESSQTAVNLKEAIVPITITVNGSKNLTVLKFKILGKDGDLNTELTSRTITLSCGSC